MEWLGKVYRARHRSGAASLVLVPPGHQLDGAPLAPLSVRVSSSTALAYVALEVDGAPSCPPGDFEEELLSMLEDARNMAEAALKDPDTRAHLMTTHSPRWPRQPSTFRARRALFSGGLAAAALALAVYVGTPKVHPGNPQSVALEGDAGVPVAPPALVLTNTLATSSSKGRAWSIPAEPYEGQKRPPCDPVTEREMNGGCWIRMVPNEGTTPKGQACPAGVFEKDGKCYMPAGTPKRLPSTVRE